MRGGTERRRRSAGEHVYALWRTAAVALALIHAVATAAALALGSVAAGGVLGGTKKVGRRRRNRGLGGNGRGNGKASSLHISGGRWALEALAVGGRRWKRRHRRGRVRAIGLGTQSPWDQRWAPWTSEEEAAAEECNLVRCDGSVANLGVVDASRPNVSAQAIDTSTIGASDWGTARRRHGRRRAEGSGRPTTVGGRRRVGRRPNRTVVAAMALASLLACRVGEAANPGPARPAAYDDGPAPLVDASWKKVLEYPVPHRDGFRDIATAGFDEEADSPGRRKEEEEFGLLAEVVNSTGWGPLKRRLLSTSSQLVLAQETWVLQDQVAGASTWARKIGWEAIWAPAAVGDGGGASGGVAIFARAGLGLRYPPGRSSYL